MLLSPFEGNQHLLTGAKPPAGDLGEHSKQKQIYSDIEGNTGLRLECFFMSVMEKLQIPGILIHERVKVLPTKHGRIYAILKQLGSDLLLLSNGGDSDFIFFTSSVIYLFQLKRSPGIPQFKKARQQLVRAEHQIYRFCDIFQLSPYPTVVKVVVAGKRPEKEEKCKTVIRDSGFAYLFLPEGVSMSEVHSWWEKLQREMREVYFVPSGRSARLYPVLIALALMIEGNMNPLSSRAALQDHGKKLTLEEGLKPSYALQIEHGGAPRASERNPQRIPAARPVQLPRPAAVGGARGGGRRC
jgi:hypothetical protein